MQAQGTTAALSRASARAARPRTVARRPLVVRAATAVVTGGSRGIGLALVKQLLQRGDTVIATARSGASAPALQQLAASAGGRLHVTDLDASKPESIQRWAAEVQEKAARVDLLINNAGAMEQPKPFGQVPASDLTDMFALNAAGPFLVTQELYSRGLLGQPATVANISSGLGSIAFKDWDFLTAYGYRASKAALNMLTRHMDVALAGQGVTCVALHPGTVLTDANPNGDISPEESAEGLLAVLGSGRDLHGRFFTYTGDELPW